MNPNSYINHAKQTQQRATQAGSFLSRIPPEALYVLIVGVLLGLLGFSGYLLKYIPFLWNYLLIELVCVLIGYLHFKQLDTRFDCVKDSQFGYIFLITFCILLLGAGLFYLAFNLVSPFKNSVWSFLCSFIIFPFPILIHYLVETAFSIPPKAYELWFFDPNYRPIVRRDGEEVHCFFHLKKDTYSDNTQLARVEVDLSVNDHLGDLFQCIIEEYNNDDDESAHIKDLCANDKSIGWYFYTPKWWGKRQLNTSKTIRENNIKPEDIIFAERRTPINK